jgi:stress-induced morphogen
VAGVNTDEVAALIRADISEATVDVSTPRNPDDDDHFAATVVSSAFEGESLVDRHQRVYDALGDHMTRDIHAIELETYTPAEAEQ